MATDFENVTESDSHGPRARAGVKLEAHLFVALDCGQPLTLPSRFLLDAETVVLGRAGTRAAHHGQDAAGRLLTLGFTDRRMSQAHAKLSRALGEWVVEDLGSKNGTRLNGLPIARAVLCDGDLLELGQTFFFFREGLPMNPALSPALDASLATEPGLLTFDPNYSVELGKLVTLAPTNVPVMLLGESGTGKEVVASTLHRLSARPGAFQAVNTGALPEHLIESELFGFRRGAFSGAMDDRKGLVRGAEGGTLFLDEIGDLPLGAQTALLRVLQESEVTPLGSSRPVKVDFRLVTATHRDLRSMALEGRFRPDLLARLSGFSLKLPPVRERREDLGIFISSLMGRMPSRGAAPLRFTTEAGRALLLYDWPLNVRELERCLASASALAGDEPIDVHHLPPAVVDGPPPEPGGSDRREELVALLREHSGNVAAVGRVLGKARMQIHRWIKRYEIDLNELRR